MDLLERLRKVEPDTPGDRTRWYRNPDGHEAAAEIERLREALQTIDSTTISHIDGRDLLDELHPRNTLNILRRVDGVETWHEADWLSSLRIARNKARAALKEKE